jgi:hypothetical protein
MPTGYIEIVNNSVDHLYYPYVLLVTGSIESNLRFRLESY